MLEGLAALVGIILMCVVLYKQGYFIWGSKRAVMFAGPMLVFGNKTSARMSRGTVILKKIMKFSYNGKVTLNLDCEVRNGGIIVEIIDENKDKMVHLDINNLSGSFSVKKNKTYYLVIQTFKMDGRYTVSWE